MWNKYTKGTGIGRIRSLGDTSGMTLSQIAAASELTKGHVCQLMRQYNLPYMLEPTYHKGYWPRRKLAMKKIRVTARVVKHAVKGYSARLAIDSMSEEHKLASWKDLPGYLVESVRVIGVDEVEMVLTNPGLNEVKIINGLPVKKAFLDGKEIK